MHRDAQEAGIDRPSLWAQYVEFEHIKAMAQAYRPAEVKLRELISAVIKTKADVKLLESLRDQIAETLMRMETEVRPENAVLLREMSLKLSRIVERQEEENTAEPAQR
jgi:hypothetical protein